MQNNTITRLVVGAISTNCWIYRLDESTAAVIDPGDEGGKILSVLQKQNLTLKYILLTHGHFDHIAAVPQLANSNEIAIHRLDAIYLGKDSYNAHIVSAKAAMGDTSFIDRLMPSSGNMPEATRLLEEGDEIGPFTVLHLPGHTPGSIAFWDKKNGHLFTGDTLFAGDWGRTDLPGGSEEQIMESLKRLLAMDGSIKVYPGHGGATTIANECLVCSVQ